MIIKETVVNIDYRLYQEGTVMLQQFFLPNNGT
jgi:hypothetical protein